jgi:hypothetical protein
MRNKIIKLFVAFVVLFSLQGFSQTTEKSEHPLLDKYYPQQRNVVDTNKAIRNQIEQLPDTKPVAGSNNIPTLKTKPVVTATTTAPVITTTTVPAVPTTLGVTNSSTTSSISAVTTSPTLNKQDTITASVPEEQKVQTQPVRTQPTQSYLDTRLGSSSPQYDTWEKNSNGAGSVTTSNK